MATFFFILHMDLNLQNQRNKKIKKNKKKINFNNPCTRDLQCGLHYNLEPSVNVANYQVSSMHNASV